MILYKLKCINLYNNYFSKENEKRYIILKDENTILK